MLLVVDMMAVGCGVLSWCSLLWLMDPSEKNLTILQIVRYDILSIYGEYDIDLGKDFVLPFF